MPGRKHGSTGQVKMDPTGGSTLAVVADLKSWTLDQARDQVDVTAFGDTNRQYVLGLPDTKGTWGGLWNSASTPPLFDVAVGAIAVKLNLIPSTTDPTFYFEGLAYLDASIDVSADGAITTSGNWVAAGNWTLMP
jgi:hypothetical protein